MRLKMTELEHVVTLIDNFVTRHSDLFIVFGLFGILAMVAMMLVVCFFAVVFSTHLRQMAR